MRVRESYRVKLRITCSQIWQFVVCYNTQKTVRGVSALTFSVPISGPSPRLPLFCSRLSKMSDLGLFSESEQDYNPLSPGSSLNEMRTSSGSDIELEDDDGRGTRLTRAEVYYIP